ncbi:uncharacterized protein LOC122623712 [Drosophila teissieri]|uniref:uncharacterized protein LOC122623712 n=1 Tax=Drosophila teissieri TaxID=7243 RepID=UPI001CBA0EA1|nr:uncharacterized protein LOC122623712 [Drosophila teissieri]
MATGEPTIGWARLFSASDLSPFSPEKFEAHHLMLMVFPKLSAYFYRHTAQSVCIWTGYELVRYSDRTTYPTDNDERNGGWWMRMWMEIRYEKKKNRNSIISSAWRLF